MAKAIIGTADERTEPASGWDPALVERIYDLLDTVDTASPALLDALRKLEEHYGDLVYSELIYLLSQLRFEPDEARLHWQRILERRENMGTKGGPPVDARVALVSYFVEVHRKLRNPMIIEMKLFERTRACAYRDELTGLHNYRMFREYVEQEILRSQRHSSPLSLVMLDIDSFKTYNDTNGHEAGNEILVEIAGVLRDVLRMSDVAARYGGEEFALILPGTSKAGAAIVAERAREGVERRVFENEDSQPGGRITVSAGVATFPADAMDAGELVRHADRAMYVAKTQGKNQVQLYGKNRRSFPRIDTALRGEFRTPAPGFHAMTTINVSEAGLLISTEHAVEVGALVEFRLQIPGDVRPLAGAGRVVHTEAESAGRRRVAISIREIAGRDRALLNDYLRSLARRTTD